jgi:uncharacterized protein involved in type VI secretion and phage assembly
VRHTYQAGKEYVTSFSINGRRPNSLNALLRGSTQKEARTPGLVVGLVTNINDPEERGRIKVKFPWLSDDVESAWARIASPGAGPDRGLYWLPEVNDEVLLGFEHGDPNRPYVLGSLWNGQDNPPIPLSEALENGKIRHRIFQTRLGHKISLIDGSKQSILLETVDGHLLALEDEDRRIRLTTANGLALVLDDSSNEISLDSQGTLNIKSGTNLTIEAGANLELKGQTFSLSSSATGEVKAGANLDVKGAVVKIN